MFIFMTRMELRFEIDLAVYAAENRLMGLLCETIDVMDAVADVKIKTALAEHGRRDSKEDANG